MSDRRAYDRAYRQRKKRETGIPQQLAQPALLTDRAQPIRRPILRLKKP